MYKVYGLHFSFIWILYDFVIDGAGAVFDVVMFDGYYYSFANASDVVCWWDGAVACMFMPWFEILRRLLFLLFFCRMLFVCLMIEFLAVWTFFVLIFTYW